MFLKTALILCEGPKTDAELKAIMATHPWAPALIHGFRSVHRVAWEDEYYVSRHSPPGSIYLDVGYSFVGEKWLVKNFHEPFHHLMDLEWNAFKERHELKEDWWKATAALLLSGIPVNYHSHVVYYGEIEDEFEPGQAEEAWKQAILENYDYDPKVIAEFESTVA
jgi:hypothetical protein